MVPSEHIVHWIADLPDPSDPSLARIGRKRCWAEMSDTMQQTPERRSRIPTPNTSYGGPEVDDATPRPAPYTRDDTFTSPHPRPSPSSMFSTFPVPDLRPSPSASSASSVRSSATHSNTGSSQIRGLKRKKNESPKRLLRNLTLARYSVEQQDIETMRDLREGAWKLAGKMRRCEKRVGILHEDIRAVMEPHLDLDDDGMFSDQRACVGEPAPYADIVNLVEIARQMEKTLITRQRGIAVSITHCSILHCATRHGGRSSDVTMCRSSVQYPLRGMAGADFGGRSTVAWIQSDAFDLPEYGQGTEGPDRKIDFSIGLRLSDQNEKDLFRSTSAVNPTLHEPTRFVPTTVHIETKLTGEGMREAQSQLLHWLPRHIAKLRELLARAGKPENTPIPVLPVLVVQGHEWKCLYYEDQSTKARLLSRTGYTIGSTGTIVGAYAVVAALQYLMDWSEQEYRPWFKENILQPLLAKAQV